LVRAKIGRIAGAFQGLLMVMKGLPLSYQKDMQEDKEQTFDALASASLAIAAMTGMVRDMTADEAAMLKAAGSGYATATDLADWLVRELGLPFREAHHVTGRAVKAAEDAGIGLDALSIETLKQIDARIDERVYDVLTVESSVASRTSLGGTAPVRVREAIAAATARRAGEKK